MATADIRKRPFGIASRPAATRTIAGAWSKTQGIGSRRPSSPGGVNRGGVVGGPGYTTGIGTTATAPYRGLGIHAMPGPSTPLPPGTTAGQAAALTGGGPSQQITTFVGGSVTTHPGMPGNIFSGDLAGRFGYSWVTIAEIAAILVAGYLVLRHVGKR